MDDNKTREFNAQAEVQQIKARLDAIEAAVRQIGQMLKYAGNTILNGGKE